MAFAEYCKVLTRGSFRALAKREEFTLESILTQLEGAGLSDVAADSGSED